MPQYTIKMRKFLTILALAATFTASAQCVPLPICTQSETVDGTLSQLTINGNICFTGSGNILGNVNVNNWQYQRFTSTRDFLYSHVAINMPYNTKTFNEGVVYYSALNMTGGDTCVVTGGSTLRVFIHTSNNSFGAQKNVISLGPGAHFYYMGSAQQWVEYLPGDTLHYGPNTTNDIYIVSCTQNNVALGQEVITWEERNGRLYWKTENPVFIERSKDQKDWMVLEFGSEGNIPATPGFYRLQLSAGYSNIIYIKEMPTQAKKTGLRWYFNGTTLELIR